MFGLAPGQRYIVANGHHRFGFGQRQDVQAYMAQVLREADGYTDRDARILAAEANIADGKGTTYDQVKYLRNLDGTRTPDEEMGERKRLGIRGRQAATIAFDAGNDLYAAFVNQKVSPEQAEAIAAAAPKNPAAQSIGIKLALKGTQPGALSALVDRAVSEHGAGRGTGQDINF